MDAPALTSGRKSWPLAQPSPAPPRSSSTHPGGFMAHLKHASPIRRAASSETVPAQPFDPWCPVLKQRDDGGAHYSVFGLRNTDDGIEALRRIFPDGRADSMNFVL